MSPAMTPPGRSLYALPGFIILVVDDLEAAWDELHDVVPLGWVVHARCSARR